MNAKIGRWQGAGLMATTLLGTGVFILPQVTVKLAGVGALWAWAILTLTIIPVTLIFGKLSGRYPHSAGPAYFVEKAFGRTLGRTIGLIFLFVVPFGAPAAILMTFEFVKSIYPVEGTAELMLQLLVVLGLFLVGRQGLQLSAKVQFALTLTVVAIVIALFAASGVHFEKLEWQPMDEMAISPVFAAMGIAFWSFLGVEAMSHLADDFEDPKKDMLPAMIIGVVLVGIIYLACTTLILLVPTESSLAMAGIFDKLLGGYGAIVIGILGILSGLATVNVYNASAARLVRSFSEEGLLPSSLAKVNNNGVPERALSVILSFMATILVLTFISEHDLESLIAWTNGVFVIIYLMAMLAAIRLLSKRNLPLIITGCGFCLAMGYALGASMSYAVGLALVSIPLIWRQKKYLAAKQAAI
ncbi:L-methionine/branched-chain amino acid transporter [Parashewanella curva]|uniref:L-methionine/branched-chain amino acid transporter n=1 Tax=Parashewanella curva TaxID=2338552 RepID=A0A3L8PZD7_9GAMM|nr:L-methionine/branched-chain amino acid transporter [Parashewanella curva]RLV60767.1 L-methionine/branched-chain amino acid transporter [Parashewanella curva]